MDMRIVFDPAKIKTVPIDRVAKNEWNPKDEEGEDYQNIVASIRENGQRIPVVVRQKGEGWEIIDGEHRWKAAKALGFPGLLVYDEGVIGDQEARELLVCYQQQVPFNRASFMRFVAEELPRFPGIKLPLQMEEIERFRSEYPFRWDVDEKDWNTIGPPTHVAGATLLAQLGIEAAPKSVAELFWAEIKRLREQGGAKDPYEALAMMATASSQTMPEEVR